MPLKIDFEKMADDPLHWLRIGLYIAIVAAVLIPLAHLIVSLAGWNATGWGGLTIGYPAIVVGGIRVAEGIARFKGEMRAIAWQSQYTWVILSLCISGLILPALFLWGVRARARWRLNPGGRGLLAMITVALTIGGMALVNLLSAVPLSITAWRVMEKMRDDNTLSAENDLLVDEVSLMATKARVHYFLPASRGGGGGGWMSRDNSQTPTITLADIELPSTAPQTIWDRGAYHGPHSFVLEVVNPDSLVIWGVGSGPSLSGADLPNKDGRRGRLQVHIGVVPNRATLISAID